MTTILKKVINFLVNEKIIYFFVLFYQKFLQTKLEKAKTQLITQSIKDKGTDCVINWNTKIYDRDMLSIGDGVRIGENSHLFCKGGITIDSHTIISRNVIIYSANHNIEGCHIPYDTTYTMKKVEIGSGVWIGMNVLITPGVKIGDGSVIGMGTIVSKDVPEGAIVVGSTQRIIKYRNMKLFREKYTNKLFFSDLINE